MPDELKREEGGAELLAKGICEANRLTMVDTETAIRHMKYASKINPYPHFVDTLKRFYTPDTGENKQ